MKGVPSRRIILKAWKWSKVLRATAKTFMPIRPIHGPTILLAVSEINVLLQVTMDHHLGRKDYLEIEEDLWVVSQTAPLLLFHRCSDLVQQFLLDPRQPWMSRSSVTGHHSLPRNVRAHLALEDRQNSGLCVKVIVKFNVHRLFLAQPKNNGSVLRLLHLEAAFHKNHKGTFSLPPQTNAVSNLLSLRAAPACLNHHKQQTYRQSQPSNSVSNRHMFHAQQPHHKHLKLETICLL